MAIIYSYPKTAPLAADLLIVSRQPSDPDETANYSVSVSDIATLVTGLQQYTLKAGTKVGTSVPLTLDSDTGTDSTVNFTEGSNITLTQTSATEITIAASSGISGSGVSGQVVFWDGTSSINGNNNLFWDNTNNYLGINTATPTSALDVSGLVTVSQSINVPLVYKSNTDLNLIGGGPQTDFSRSQIKLFNAGDVTINASSGRPVTINSGGSFAMVLDSAQQVGIGITSPDQKLHVVGNTKIAGVVIVNSVNSSLYIGSSTTGQSSTSTGDRNVAIGPSAFRSNTSATYNTAVGHAAMQDTTTGNYNSVLGNQAMKENIGGSFNVAVGNQALNFTTSSGNNTAVGYRALFQAQSGSNTAIGQGALNSLQSSTNSGDNTGIGQGVLNKITSGRRNVGVGVNAGQKYGGTNNNVVTANDSVFIGNESDAGGDNQTNQIVIGYNAIGLGSNTVVLGNNSIVTTQLKGNVGIGTTSPGVKLDVNGRFRVQDNGNIALDVNTDGAFQIGDTAEVGGGAFITGDNTDIDIIADGGPVVTFKGSGNVGIGTTSPASKLEVDGGDIEIDDSASGLILRSPNGTRYRVQVDNSGNLTTTAI